MENQIIGLPMDMESDRWVGKFYDGQQVFELTQAGQTNGNWRPLPAVGDHWGRMREAGVFLINSSHLETPEEC